MIVIEKVMKIDIELLVKCIGRAKLFDVAYMLRYLIILLTTFFFLGISGKSQILFAIVYFSRYLDLFTTYISLYNTSMKLIFIVSSFGTLYLMYVKFRATYDHNHDSFRIEFLLVPCVILALLINHDFSVLEVSLKDGTSNDYH